MTASSFPVRISGQLAVAVLASTLCSVPACRRASGPVDAVAQATPSTNDPAGAVGLRACTAPKRPRGRLRRAEKLAAARIRAASKLVRRGPDRQELWQTPYGEFWVVPSDFDTFVWVLAEQEMNIYGDETTGVRPGDVVLDCGAHFGGYVRKALGMGAKVVVAIELAPENIACLRKTFASEVAAGRVIVYPKGVWDKDDQLVLYRSDHTWGDRAISVEEGGRTGPAVPLTTIDKIVAELRLARVDFIKMDIEGAEPNALSGAAATLRSFRPRMALAAYHHGAQDLVDLPAVARKAQPAYDVCLWGADAGWGNQTLFFR
jgi:FkbM family methyltransferase